MDQQIQAPVPDMLMSEMLDTVREAQRRMLDHGTSDSWIALAASLGKVGDFLEQAVNKVHGEKACIRMATFDKDGHCMSWGDRTSSDPQRDKDNMLGFLEMRDAFEKRGVPVRFKLGALWVTSQVPPELPDPAFKAPPVHAAIKLAIDLAESAGMVLRVYSKPNPFELRMGGHYMVYELRDNLATARIKAAEPCVIVKASNYDDDGFNERFYNDPLAKVNAMGPSIYTRDEAGQLMRKLNADPKRDDSIYYKVEPAGYKLYEWEP